MPIVFVHGVANREGRPLWAATQALELLLRRYVAPAINPGDPAAVEVFFPYWGELGAAFAWGGISRPRSAFLGHGAAPEATFAEQAERAAEFQRTLAAAPVAAAATAAGPWVAQGRGDSLLDLAELPPEALAHLASDLLQQGIVDPVERARAAIAADGVAHDPNTQLALRHLAPGEDQVMGLAGLLAKALEGPFTGHGARFDEFCARLGETVSRALGLPGWVTTQVLSEVRPSLHEALTTFFGDVFCYLARRGTAAAPGEIPLHVLADLQRAHAIKQRSGEPLVVLSHSMGGQIVFDLVTTFIPVLAPELKIDLWAASASQVGLMEELRLFLRDDSKYGPEEAQAMRLAPSPVGAQLARWWNVWDPNDFLSFTARGIFAGVDDSAFDSGLSVATAHGGYLVRPSFYRELAARVR